ncbi:MAG: hypothetical protein RIR10_1578, partial [Planctomycetota bacterium]
MDVHGCARMWQLPSERIRIATKRTIDDHAKLPLSADGAIECAVKNALFSCCRREFQRAARLSEQNRNALD